MNAQNRRNTFARSDWIEGMARGMAVLECFDTERQRLNASQTAERTGLTRAAARRHLLTLTELGYLESDGHFYWLTPKVLGFAGSYLASARLPRTVQPTLMQLSALTQTACSVAVLQSDAVVIVARGVPLLSSTGQPVPTPLMAYGLHVGTRLPAHATSTGQVLLANQASPPSLPLPRLTPYTLTDPDAFAQRLREVAQQDHCWADQEHELGIAALAVPLRNALGHTVAALNMVHTHAQASHTAWRARWLPVLQQTAQGLRPLL